VPQELLLEQWLAHNLLCKLEQHGGHMHKEMGHKLEQHGGHMHKEMGQLLGLVQHKLLEQLFGLVQQVQEWLSKRLEQRQQLE
jgi:hypothetical protein